jgi:hypothetical protein
LTESGAEMVMLPGYAPAASPAEFAATPITEPVIPESEERLSQSPPEVVCTVAVHGTPLPELRILSCCEGGLVPGAAWNFSSVGVTENVGRGVTSSVTWIVCGLFTACASESVTCP